jgi:Holliday junction resolvase RusA-like endonuclease
VHVTPIELALPWPSPRLNPNARQHWSALAKAKKRARADAFVRVRSLGHRIPAGVPLRLSLRFAPPTRARRDLDNLLASCKAALDGVAEALGVDDSRFRPVLDWAPPERGGVVYVRIEVQP